MSAQEIVTPQPVEAEVIIETRGLSRVYPGVIALDNVDYRVYRNKVNVLIGENGAGKSTMMKMLAGVETPSSGQIILEGSPVSLNSTHQAEKQGISIIFQELNLFPNMNVMDNIFMANEFSRKEESTKNTNTSWLNHCWNGWSSMLIPILRLANWVLAISSWSKLRAPCPKILAY